LGEQGDVEMMATCSTCCGPNKALKGQPWGFMLQGVSWRDFAFYQLERLCIAGQELAIRDHTTFERVVLLTMALV
jgi:hypothetical protein